MSVQGSTHTARPAKRFAEVLQSNILLNADRLVHCITSLSETDFSSSLDDGESALSRGRPDRRLQEIEVPVKAQS